MWMHNRVAVRKGLKLKLKCVSVFLVSVLETCEDFDCRYCGNFFIIFVTQKSSDVDPLRSRRAGSENKELNLKNVHGYRKALQ